MTHLVYGETGLFQSNVYSTTGSHTGKRFGVVLDSDETHYLVFSFSSDSMSKFTKDSHWKSQLLVASGLGGKNKDSWGAPNLTHWIPKSCLKSSCKGAFDAFWIDYFIEEIEKFWGKSFEDITFPSPSQGK